jgi:competence protein ComEC
VAGRVPGSGPARWRAQPLDAVAAGGASLGIAIYFELPSEPALWPGPALAALVFFAPADSLSRGVAIGLVAAAVGFSLIAWRIASLAAPTLSRPSFNINVEGRIADIQRLPEVVRVVLEAVRLKGSGRRSR